MIDIKYNDDYSYSDIYMMDGLHSSIEIYTHDDNGKVIQLSNEQIHLESFEINQSICSGSDLIFGGCESAYCKFTVTSDFPSLVGKYIWIQSTLTNESIEPSRVDNYISLGSYRVVSDEWSANRVSRNITAYDKMYELQTINMYKWYESLNFPISVGDMRKSAIDYIKLNDDTKGKTYCNDTVKISKVNGLSDLTAADVFRYISEMSGGFGIINTRGYFDIINLKNDSVFTYTSSHIKNMNYEDNKSEKIKMIYCENEKSYTYITNTNENGIIYPIQNIKLLKNTDVSTINTLLRNINTVVKDIDYQKYNCDFRGNPCLEIGDKIAYQSDKDNFNGYLTERRIKGIHAITDTASCQNKYANRDLPDDEKKDEGVISSDPAVGGGGINVLDCYKDDMMENVPEDTEDGEIFATREALWDKNKLGFLHNIDNLKVFLKQHAHYTNTVLDNLSDYGKGLQKVVLTPYNEDDNILANAINIPKYLPQVETFTQDEMTDFIGAYFDKKFVLNNKFFLNYYYLGKSDGTFIYTTTRDFSYFLENIKKPIPPMWQGYMPQHLTTQDTLEHDFDNVQRHDFEIDVGIYTLKAEVSEILCDSKQYIKSTSTPERLSGYSPTKSPNHLMCDSEEPTGPVAQFGTPQEDEYFEWYDPGLEKNRKERMCWYVGEYEIYQEYYVEIKFFINDKRIDKIFMFPTSAVSTPTGMVISMIPPNNEHRTGVAAGAYEERVYQIDSWGAFIVRDYSELRNDEKILNQINNNIPNKTRYRYRYIVERGCYCNKTHARLEQPEITTREELDLVAHYATRTFKKPEFTYGWSYEESGKNGIPDKYKYNKTGKYEIKNTGFYIFSFNYNNGKLSECDSGNVLDYFGRMDILKDYPNRKYDAIAPNFYSFDSYPDARFLGNTPVPYTSAYDYPENFVEEHAEEITNNSSGGLRLIDIAIPKSVVTGDDKPITESNPDAGIEYLSANEAVITKDWNANDTSFVLSELNNFPNCEILRIGLNKILNIQDNALKEMTNLKKVYYYGLDFEEQNKYSCATMGKILNNTNAEYIKYSKCFYVPQDMLKNGKNIQGGSFVLAYGCSSPELTIDAQGVHFLFPPMVAAPNTLQRLNLVLAEDVTVYHSAFAGIAPHDGTVFTLTFKNKINLTLFDENVTVRDVFPGFSDLSQLLIRFPQGSTGIEEWCIAGGVNYEII